MDFRTQLVAVASLQENIIQNSRQDANRFHQFISGTDTRGYLNYSISDDEYETSTNFTPQFDDYELEFSPDLSTTEKATGLLYSCEFNDYDVTNYYFFTVPFDYFGNAEKWEKEFLERITNDEEDALKAIFDVFPDLDNKCKHEGYKLHPVAVWKDSFDYTNDNYDLPENTLDTLNPEYLNYILLKGEESTTYAYNGVEYFFGYSPVTVFYKIATQEVFAFEGDYGSLKPVFKDGSPMTKPLARSDIS